MTATPLEPLFRACEQLLALAEAFPEKSNHGSPRIAIGHLVAKFQKQRWPPEARQTAESAQSVLNWLDRFATIESQRNALTAVRRAADAVRQWFPRLELTVDAATDLRPDCECNELNLVSDLVKNVRRVADRTLNNCLRDTAVRLLERPPSDIPSPRSSHFTTVWSGETRVGVKLSEQDGIIVTRMADNDSAIFAGQAAFAALVPGDRSPVFVVWIHSGVACVTTTHVAREHWWQLLKAGRVSDAVIFPGDGRWVTSYFHHGWAWMARLHSEQLISIVLRELANTV